jgi:hypothetical protein
MLAEVGVALEPHDTEPGSGIIAPESRPATEGEVAALRADLHRAAVYGVDLSLIRASLDKTPVQRLRENDEAIAFFGCITVTPGWSPEETAAPRGLLKRSARPGRGRKV